MDRAGIALETLRVLKAGGYTAPSGRYVSLKRAANLAVSTTSLRREGITPEPAAPDPSSSTATIEVTREPSAVACRRLGGRVAVLNFANGVTRGGGFLAGSRAQEEQLCRCSSLFLSLDSRGADAYYDEQEQTHSALVLDHVLTTECVTFFRDEDFAFLERPFVATVLTCAAPNLGWLHATVDSGREPADRFDRVEETLRRRARAIVAAAHAAEVDALVLGAWGCGAFGNDAAVVADAFANALDEFDFAHVVFAIYKGPEENYTAFVDRFGTAS